MNDDVLIDQVASADTGIGQYCLALSQQRLEQPAEHLDQSGEGHKSFLALGSAGTSEPK